MNTTELVTIRGRVLEATSPTFNADDVRLRWLAQYLNPHTLVAYDRDITALFTWAESYGLEPLYLNREQLNAWAQHLNVDLAASTVARRLTAVASFYEYAIDLGIITVNPAARIKRPKCGPDHVKLTGALDPSEVARLVAAATSAQDTALVVLLATTGLRISEALQVKVESITTERGHSIISVTGKGGKVNTVPLPPVTIAALSELAAIRGHGPLFMSHTGVELTRHGAARILTRLAHRAALGKDVSPHMLRAAAVTNALVAGVPLHVVQAMANHADPKTTHRYYRAANNLDNHASYTLGQGLSAAISQDMSHAG